jgi:AcrR family transcriptional regulator
VTRRRILAAARLRFSSDGYGATTLQAIAAAAGVAVQTVYAVHGSKAGILRELREALVRQPEAERLYGAALEAADADDALVLFARSIRVRWEAGADVVRIHAEAAASDSTLRAEVQLVLARRREGIARLTETLGGSLADGVDVGRATAIVDALTLPEVYAELTGAAGWSPDAYEAWLGAGLRRELLRSSAPRAD